MKKLSGFSLMEMMVVLLIVAVVAAASAPMVNKKLVTSTDKSPWVWTRGASIAYNLQNTDDITATIGALTPPSSANSSRMYIKTNASNGNYTPQIALGDTGAVGAQGNIMKITSAHNSIWISNSLMSSTNPVDNAVVIGRGAFANATNSTVLADDSIAIGTNANTTSYDTIAIGTQASSTSDYAIAIGNNAHGSMSALAIGQAANADGSASIAIGQSAYSQNNASDAIAVGRSANVQGADSIAIGRSANSYGANSIVMGLNATAGTNSSSTAPDSIVLGRLAKSFGENAIALGHNATANAVGSIAIGSPSDTSTANITSVSGSSNDSIAIGTNSSVSNASNSVVIGSGLRITGPTSFTTSALTNAVLIGADTSIPSGSSRAIAIGSNLGANNSVSIGHRSVVIGTNSNASANAISIGGNVTVAVSGIAIGKNIHASGSSVAIGDSLESSNGTILGTKASGNAISIGRAANTNAGHAIAIGSGMDNAESGTTGWFATNATGIRSIALGAAAAASEQCAIAIGGAAVPVAGAYLGAYNLGRTVAAAGSAVAIGSSARVRTGANSAIAIGSGASVSTDSIGSIAIGQSASVSDNVTNSVAIGAGAIADTNNQIVLGRDSETVYIPGNLRVDGNIELATKESSTVKIGLHRNHDATGAYHFSYLVRGGGAGEDAQDVLLGKNTQQPTLPSDSRLKNVGKVFKGGLEELKKLELFHYTYKKDKSKTPHVGVMAQDLQKVFPDAVFKGEDGFLRIRMEDMFYALVNAVKELDAKIEALKNEEILVLKNRVDKLEKENKALEKRLAALEKKLK